MREIESLIEFWQRQEEAAKEKRKTETFLDATGMCIGPDTERDENGHPKYFTTMTDNSIGVFITWRKELEKFRDLFDTFRTQIDEHLTEEAIAAAEKFYLESISHHTVWGISERDWVITINLGSPWVGIQFELFRLGVPR